ncbi:MAG: isoprenylcysteine carboxylmethyltransferase family protein [Kordiimonadaceae bacterium]|nr:isoprenylcysteine carboxylmethyltransferase family protein [Kordiimonadaceae bacterium]
MFRMLTALYGLTSYLVGVGSLVLFILFANNHMGLFGIEGLKSLNIDAYNNAPSSSPLLDNIALMLLFGVQHSIMARPVFKEVLTKILPSSWERSTYLLATGIVTIALVQFWEPMTAPLWVVENEAGRFVITAVFYLGWAITFLATFMLNHFHLFGLQQSFMPNDPDQANHDFVTPMFYKFVRHPIQTGVVIAMLATPDMTMGRAVLAAGMLGYIAIGLFFEERDLIRTFGDTYRTYKAHVPALFPFTKRRK